MFRSTTSWLSNGEARKAQELLLMDVCKLIVKKFSFNVYVTTNLHVSSCNILLSRGTAESPNLIHAINKSNAKKSRTKLSGMFTFSCRNIRCTNLQFTNGNPSAFDDFFEFSFIAAFHSAQQQNTKTNTKTANNEYIWDARDALTKLTTQFACTIFIFTSATLLGLRTRKQIDRSNSSERDHCLQSWNKKADLIYMAYFDVHSRAVWSYFLRSVYQSDRSMY